MRLLITRPREDGEPLAALLNERGFETILDPMMTIVDIDAPEMDLSGIQALLMTSANGVRAFARREEDRQTPVYVVGDASAQVARDLSFIAVTSAGGDVETLAALVQNELNPGQGALLHIAASRVAGDLSGLLEAAGFEVRRLVLYEATAADALSTKTLVELDAGTLDGILLFSPRTATLFTRLVMAAGRTEHCRAVVAYCLSQAVADNAQVISWKDLVVAPRPNQQALLDIIGGNGG